MRSLLGIFGILCTGWVLSSTNLSAQESPPPAVTKPDVRVYVPLEELDQVFRRDKQGVLLSREQFEELQALAKQNAPTEVPAGIGSLIQRGNYVAKIVDEQLQVTVELEIRQFAPGWQSVPFRISGLSVERAREGDQPARLGRDAADPAQLLIFLQEPGLHRVTLELSQPLNQVGSDQLVAFQVSPLPSAELTIDLPAQKYLQWNELPLERPAPADQAAKYQIPLGGQKEVVLRVTDRPTEQATEGLAFAQTVLGLSVSPAEITWRAVTHLQVFGRGIDELKFQVPETLQIVSIRSPGLESWTFGEGGPENGLQSLNLHYRQPFTGDREVELQALLVAPAGESWQVPTLHCANVSSHTTQVVIQSPQGVRVQVDEVVGLRREAAGEQPAASVTTMQFSAWRPDFVLRLTTQPRAREISAAVATSLDVTSTNLRLESSLTLETRFAPLFEAVLKVPADWAITQVKVRDAAVDWELTPEEAGWNLLRIPVQPPIPAGSNGLLLISAERKPEGWPITESSATIELPEIQLPQANLVEGTYLVTGEDELDLEVGDLRGLDPLGTTDNQARARLNYEYQDARYGGQLTVARRPALIASRTLAFHRLERDVARSYLEATLDVRGGGVRRLQIAVPEALGEGLRWELRNAPGASIAEQTVANGAMGPAGQKIYTLAFDRRLTGVFSLFTAYRAPRAGAESWTPPTLQVVNSQREAGHIAFEAEHDQELSLTATNVAGTPLAEIDPADLPASVAYTPEERIVAAYSHVLPGYTVALKERWFERLPVPTAVCDKLTLSSILGETGEFQHVAEFQFRAIGVQGLRLQLPSDALLWATLLNSEPIEVRKTGDAYFIPLIAGRGGNESRQLKLFYRTALGKLEASGKWSQSPPLLSVLNGDGTEQPLEVLRREWTLHHPASTEIVTSVGDYVTEESRWNATWLRKLLQVFQVDSPFTLLSKVLWIGLFIGALWLLRMAVSRSPLITVGAIAVGVLLLGGLMFMVRNVAHQESSSGEYYSDSAKEPAASAAPQAYFQAETAPVADSLEYRTPVAAMDDLSAAVADPLTEADMDETTRLKMAEPQAGKDLSGALGGRPPTTARARSGSEATARDRRNFAFDSEAKGTNRGTELKSELSEGLQVPEGARPVAPPTDQPQRESATTAATPAETPPPPAPDAVVDAFDAPQAGQPAGQPQNQARPGGQPAAQAGDGFGRVPSLGRGLSITGGAVLSLALQFDPPADSVARTFTYHGRATKQQPRLEVTYLNHTRMTFVGLLLQALIVAVWWVWRREGWKTLSALLVLGAGLPLGLLLVCPLEWLPYLDSVLLGTIWGLLLWLVWGSTRVKWWTVLTTPIGAEAVKAEASRVSSWFLIAALSGTVFSGTAYAQPEQAPNPAAQRPAPPAPIHPGAIVVPYDVNRPDATQQSDKIFLPWNEFKALWEKAHPESVVPVVAPRTGGLVEAIFTAELQPAKEMNQPAHVAVTGRLVYSVDRAGQVVLPLPLGRVALDSVQQDGQTAAVVAVEGEAANQTPLGILFEQPGLHIVDVKLTVPVKQTGPAGSWTLPLAPVPAGTLTFRGPGDPLVYRVNGGSQGFRKVAAEEGQTQLVIPVSAGGNLTLSWRPRQQMADADTFVQAESTTAVVVSDAGLQMRMQQSLTVRQGGFTEMAFSLPEPLAIRTIQGPDLGGWQIAGEGAERTLTVFFRRRIDKSTSLIFDAVLQQPVDDVETQLTIPEFAPQGVARETGNIVVFAGGQFGLRLGTVTGLQQIEPGAVGWQAALGEQFAAGLAPQLAFRFTRRPIAWELVVLRRQPQLLLTAQHAVVVEPRRLEQFTQFVFDLRGAPRSELLILLPQGYLPQDIVSEHVIDWHISGRENAADMTAEAYLHLELAGPKLGLIEVRLLGRTSRDPGSPETAILFPYALDVEESTTAALVSLNPIYTGQTETLEDWKSIDPKWLVEKFLHREIRAGDFAFQTTSPAPGTLELKLQKVQPRLTANAVSLVTIRDEVQEHLIALRWQIASAGADTFVFTTPDWLAPALEFPTDRGPRRRSLTRGPVENGRVRWTVVLEAPVNGELFLVGSASLPPTTAGEISAPAIVFEQVNPADGMATPLETQGQYAVLVNRSQTQLTRNPDQPVENIAAEDLKRIMTLREDLLQEAAELLRVTQSGTPITWKQQKFHTEQMLPAAVNLARHLTVMDYDGSWRERVSYKLKNHSRQFLALQLPADSQILSVLVKGQPTRAVQAPDKPNWTLIPLPKTVTGDLAFDVDLVLGGQLPLGKFARNWSLWSQTVDVPAPHVISPEEDATYGIPVAQSTWTVFYPKDLDVWFVRDPNRTNVTSSTANEHRLDEMTEVLGEISELINVNSTVSSRRAKAQAFGNLKQLKGRLDQIQGGANLFSSGSARGAVTHNEAEVAKQSEVARRAEALNRSLEDVFQKNTNDYGLEAIQDQAGNTIVLDRQQQADQQQRLTELYDDNGIAVTKENAVQSFGDFLPPMGGENKPGKESGNSLNFNRGMLRKQVESQSELQQEQLEQSKQQQQLSPSVDTKTRALQFEGRNSRFAVPSTGTIAGMEAPAQPGVILNPIPALGVAVDGAPNQPAQAGAGGQMGGGGMGGGFGAGEGEAAGVQTHWGWQAAGGISLPIQFPEEGEVLHFSKVGGTPKVALSFRPHRTLQTLFGVVWAVAWGLGLVWLVRMLRRTQGRNWLLWAPRILTGLALGIFFLTRIESPLGILSLIAVLAGLCWLVLSLPVKKSAKA